MAATVLEEDPALGRVIHLRCPVGGDPAQVESRGSSPALWVSWWEPASTW